MRLVINFVPNTDELSSGSAGKIHISEATARLLIKNGKGNWVTKRADMINVKGKGSIQTFWLSNQCGRRTTESVRSSQDDTSTGDAIDAVRFDCSAQKERNVEWICQLLQYRIQNVVRSSAHERKQLSDRRVLFPESGSLPLDEVAEIVPLRSSSEDKLALAAISSDSELDDCVQAELRDFISHVAETYQSNPFHNFEHACHVTMSVNKLLSRVVPSNVNVSNEMKRSGSRAPSQSYTNEILDPLGQLATVFAAVIHDADHRGKQEREMDLFCYIQVINNFVFIISNHNRRIKWTADERERTSI
jgi:3'5'-cyclic nucleotide phosphodiesterase